ncbi:MAG: hypothetical protein EBS05_24665 [Proteobacteria bacterium]|nr:hypothetical protein [Pseudomonadota bacterium]
MNRFLATACLAALALCQPTGFAQVVTHTTPSAVAPGKPTVVTFHGSNLGGATKLWTSLGAQIEPQTNDARQATFRLTLPADAPAGLAAAWLATTNGVANLQPLFVDDLPTITADKKADGTQETAQELIPPVAVDSACKAGRAELFKVLAKAGQSLSVEVVAARLSSKLDPQLRLLDATGRELALADDSIGLGADCHLQHRFAADTTCYLEVRDVAWQGSTDYRFRLRVGSFPLVTTPYPLPNASIKAIPTNAELMANLLTAATQVLEVEPNDTPAQATPFTPPCVLNGRFATPRDRDWFSFTAKKGQRLLITSETRRAGSPAELFIRVESATGALLAESDVSSTNDVAFDVTFKQDGPVRLAVEDLLRRGGPEFAYRIRVEPFSPGFTLQAETNRFSPPQGGVFTTKVTAKRSGYNGPITLTLPGAASLFQLSSNVIAQGKSETSLRVEVPQDHPPGMLMLLSIVGTATNENTVLVTTAGTLPVVARSWPTVPFPPAGLDGVLAVGVGQRLPDFFQVALATNVVQFPAAGGKRTFTIHVTGTDKAFNTKVEFAFERLPKGLTAKMTKEPKGAGDYEVELSSPNAVAPGESDFQIIGTGTFRDQTRKVTLAKVPLHITQ